MVRSSGNCTMYLVSLQGQATSCWPSSSGAPTECMAGTNGRSSPIASRTYWPIRAMTRIETTTYSESVSSTPNIGLSASTGPMQNGMTYIVRPRMHPRYSSVMIDFISPGSIQLLVGPASASSTEQMKVRSSTRATSLGSEAHQNEFGFFARRVKVPASTSFPVSRSHSSSLPSTQTTSSGVVSSAISRTHPSSRACVVGALSRPGVATEVMRLHPLESRGGVLHRRWCEFDPAAALCNESGSGQVTDVLDVCNRERCYV